MHNSFKEGSIISMKLENFQTYKKGEFDFHPQLNFIAGPNGSGKSSIANAIAFIFAGTANTIGKTKDISEYINFKALETIVEVNIKYKGKKLTLKRTLTKAGKRSMYYINEISKSKEEYQKFINELNINVNNLCMFLPQEKVSEFACLTPSELLKETISQSNPIIINKLEKLKIFESKMKENSETINKSKESRNQILKISNNLTKDIQKIQEKHEIIEKIKLAKNKVKLLNYEILKEDYKNIKIKINNTTKEYNSKLELKNFSLDKINQLKNCKEIQILNDEKLDFDRLNLELIESLDEFKNQIRDINLLEIDLQGLIKKKENRIEEVENLKRKIGETEKRISDIKIDRIKECPVSDKLIEILMDSSYNLETKKQNMENKAEEIKRTLKSLQLKIQEIDKEENRRLESLEKYHKDTYEAVKWLRNHKTLFLDEIIEPAILSIKLKDPNYAKEVESFMSFQISSSFICKNKEDFKKFTKILKDEKKLAINVLESLPPKNSNFPKEKYKALGFEYVLLDVIDARIEIINLLEHIGHFSEIPITKKNFNTQKIFLENEELRRMICNEKYYEIKRSMYDKRDYVIVENGIKPLNILTSSTKELVSDLKNKIFHLEKEREEILIHHNNLMHERERNLEDLKKNQDILTEYRIKFNDIERLKRQKEVFINTVNVYNEKIESLKDFSDLENEKKVIENEIKNLKKNFKVEKFLKKFQNQEIYEKLIKLKEIQKEVLETENFLRIEINTKSQLEEELKKCEELQNELIEEKNQLKNKLEKIKDKINLEEVNNQSNKFNTLPSNISNLEKIIAKETAKLQFLSVNDEAIDIFKKNEDELHKINLSVTTLENKGEILKEKIEEIQNEAIGQINQLLIPFNNKFIELFRRFNCQAKLEFDFSDSDSKNWKLNVFVKFRETSKLELLTSHRQSGGEKSLTTIIFLLALQSVSPAPFRLVDEINQGMDKFNEKLVHNTLVSLATEDLSQFFIITPKIVPGLEFGECMKVHVVYSGCFCEGKEVFDGYKLMCIKD